MRASQIVDTLLEATNDSEVNRYMNQLPEPEVSLASPVKEGDGIQAPLRIVLHRANHSGEWVTHFENMQAGGYVSGHYHGKDYKGALEDYRRRCEKLLVDPDQSQQLDESKSPKMSTLKDNRVELDDDERKEVMRRKAVWHHGKNGKPTPAVWKSVIRGKTYFVCNTHRAARVKPTLKGAIRDFAFIKTTS